MTRRDSSFRKTNSCHAVGRTRRETYLISEGVWKSCVFSRRGWRASSPNLSEPYLRHKVHGRGRTDGRTDEGMDGRHDEFEAANSVLPLPPLITRGFCGLSPQNRRVSSNSRRSHCTHPHSLTRSRTVECSAWPPPPRPPPARAPLLNSI